MKTNRIFVGLLVVLVLALSVVAFGQSIALSRTALFGA